MKYFCLMLTILVNMLSLASAETIYLRNGGVVKGKILEKGEYYVTIRQGKIPKKYYNDQIVRIVKDEDLNRLSIDASQFEYISQEKVNLIVRLMEVNGINEGMRENLNNIMSKLPEEKREEMMPLFNINEMLTTLVPIYHTYYTEEEIKGLIEFYKSPLGQKVIKVTPQIMTEAMQENLKYFQGKLQR